jgi:cytochrome c5
MAPARAKAAKAAKAQPVQAKVNAKAIAKAQATDQLQTEEVCSADRQVVPVVGPMDAWRKRIAEDTTDPVATRSGFGQATSGFLKTMCKLH